MHLPDQERQTISAIFPELTAQLVNVRVKLAAIGIFAAIYEPPGTRRIVKIENGGLRECVGGAGAGGMKWIAFEFDRPAIDRGCDERDRAGATRHRGRVVKKFPGDRPLRALGERDEVHFGTTT